MDPMHRVAVLLAALPLLGVAAAQEVTLRLHHFLTETSPVHAGYLVPWAERIERGSDGRIRIEIHPNMQLGGAPPSLIDQAADGVVDLVWTLPGYTAGRFPATEAFELPFMSGLAEHASQALCEFYGEHLTDEYADVHPITLHTTGAGLFHVRGDPVRGIDDLRGLRVRAPNRVASEALALLGAEPVGMPVPEVPEALSRGVVDAALLPWEVTIPLRIPDLVDSHTGFESEHGFYASTFLLAMSPASYQALPPDLQAVIDANSMAAGCEEARIAGVNEDEADVRAREVAEELGNTVHRIPAGEVRRWRELLQPLEERWVRRMDQAGRDGEAMLERARELIRRYEAEE